MLCDAKAFALHVCKVVFVIFFVMGISFLPCTLIAGVSEDVQDNLDNGIKYYRMGVHDKAKGYFEYVLSRDPHNKKAKQYIREIMLVKLDDMPASEPQQETSFSSHDSDILETSSSSVTSDIYQQDSPQTEKAFATENTLDSEWFEAASMSGTLDDASKNASDSELLDQIGAEHKNETFMGKVNEVAAPFRLSGEYRLNFGIEGTDFTLNRSYPEFSERNSQLVFGPERENTYDRQVFNQFSLNMDLDPDGEEGWGLHTNVVIDPYSFPAKSKRTLVRGSWGSLLVVQPKHVSSLGETISEIYYTTGGSSVILPSLGVKNGKTQATTVNGSFEDKWGETEVFSIPSIELNLNPVPVREVFLDYTREGFFMRFFPMAYEDQAFTSDDPLQISNRHIYWESSPWLDQWVPGLESKSFSTPSTFRQGNWSDTLPFLTKDGNYKRITALRGFKMEWFPGFKPFCMDDYENRGSIDFTIASPKGVWDAYDSVNSLPGALRMKKQIHDKWMLGTIYTFNYGFDQNNADSEKHNVGLDLWFSPAPGTTLKGQIIGSSADFDKNKFHEAWGHRERGWTYHLQGDWQWPSNTDLASKSPTLSGKFAMTHMDKSFVPALANFSNTRQDEPWSRYIYFSNPHKGDRYVSPDVLNARIGDGIDRGRNVFSTSVTANFMDDSFTNFLYFRDVNNTSGKDIERQLRDEISWEVSPQFRTKGIFYYQWLPKISTYEHFGQVMDDPFISNARTGEYLQNLALSHDKDPSVGSYGVGMQYDFTDIITGELAWTYTNDPTSFPRGLLSSSFQRREYNDQGQIWHEVPFLYSQQYFNLPSYSYYNIVRLRLYLHPMEKLYVTLKATHNDEKYWGGIDDQLNNIGTEINYHITQRAEVSFYYMFSKSIDMARVENTSGQDVSYEDHHNLACEFRYRVRDNGLFSIEYGEHYRRYANLSETGNPYTGYNTTLDTAHILRVLYTEKF